MNKMLIETDHDFCLVNFKIYALIKNIALRNWPWLILCALPDGGHDELFGVVVLEERSDADASLNGKQANGVLKIVLKHF